jgi:hypothetical protein
MELISSKFITKKEGRKKPHIMTTTEITPRQTQEVRKTTKKVGLTELDNHY